MMTTKTEILMRSFPDIITGNCSLISQTSTCTAEKTLEGRCSTISFFHLCVVNFLSHSGAVKHSEEIRIMCFYCIFEFQMKLEIVSEGEGVTSDEWGLLRDHRCPVDTRRLFALSFVSDHCVTIF